MGFRVHGLMLRVERRGSRFSDSTLGVELFQGNVLDPESYAENPSPAFFATRSSNTVAFCLQIYSRGLAYRRLM